MPEFRDIIAGHLEARADMPWLTLISGESATPFTIRQIAERTYDYCAFYRAAGVAENDTVVIILRESLDLVAAFFAGIVCGALPAYYFYPSPKQSADLFLSSIDTLLLYNEVKLIVSYPEVISVLKDHHRISVPEFVGFYETVRGAGARQVEPRRLPGPDARGVPAVLVGHDGRQEGGQDLRRRRSSTRCAPMASSCTTARATRWCRGCRTITTWG